jgi:hypothetical protein
MTIKFNYYSCTMEEKSKNASINSLEKLYRVEKRTKSLKEVVLTINGVPELGTKFPLTKCVLTAN